MYRIALIGDAGSIHLKKWVSWYLKEGHEVLQITTRHIGKDEFLHSNVKILPDPEIKLFPGSWTLIRKTNPFRTRYLVRKFKPDIVHVHRINDELNFRIDHRPLIMNAWGSEVYQVNEGTHGYRAVIRNIERADMILGTTPHIIEHLQKKFHVDPGMMEAWSWGIDTSIFSLPENKTEFKKKAGYGGDHKLMLSPRGIADIYRNNVIVKGFLKAYEIDDSLRLMILGNNPHKKSENELMKIIGPDGHPGIKIIKERLDLQGMADLMRASDVYVGIPRSDQLSSALLESMACGCIPVVSDLPAYQGTVTDKANGYVLKKIDEEGLFKIFTSLHENIDLHSKWRGLNDEMIKNDHDWEKQAQKMIDVYDRIMKRQ